MQPIFLAPVYIEKPWGGDSFNRVFGRRQPKNPVGESFEVSGFSQECSIVRGGDYDGMTLARLFSEHPELFGGRAGEFPLLIKFIDAKGMLSVQIHPSNSVALEFEGAPVGKTEAWAIISADETARICIKSRIANSAQLLDTLYGGDIEDALIWERPVPGDVFFLPAGSIHSLGGVFLYEIQQPSDTTYRVYDWGRDRQTHPEKSAAAFDPTAEACKVRPRPLRDGAHRLVTCEYFTLDLVDASNGFACGPADDFCVYTSISDGRLACGGREQPFAAGDSFIIPSGCGKYRIDGGMLYRAAVP